MLILRERRHCWLHWKEGRTLINSRKDSFCVTFNWSLNLRVCACETDTQNSTQKYFFHMHKCGEASTTVKHTGWSLPWTMTASLIRLWELVVISWVHVNPLLCMNHPPEKILYCFFKGFCERYAEPRQRGQMRLKMIKQTYLLQLRRIKDDKGSKVKCHALPEEGHV